MRQSELLYVAKFLASVFAANTACASLLHSAARQYARPYECRAAGDGGDC